jgi:hypothetical protein
LNKHVFSCELILIFVNVCIEQFSRAFNKEVNDDCIAVLCPFITFNDHSELDFTLMNERLAEAVQYEQELANGQQSNIIQQREQRELEQLARQRQLDNREPQKSSSRDRDRERDNEPDYNKNDRDYRPRNRYDNQSDDRDRDDERDRDRDRSDQTRDDERRSKDDDRDRNRNRDDDRDRRDRRDRDMDRDRDREKDRDRERERERDFDRQKPSRSDNDAPRDRRDDSNNDSRNSNTVSTSSNDPLKDKLRQQKAQQERDLERKIALGSIVKQSERREEKPSQQINKTEIETPSKPSSSSPDVEHSDPNFRVSTATRLALSLDASDEEYFKSSWQLLLKYFDHNKTNSISINDIGSAFRAMGLDPSVEKLKDLFYRVDLDHSGNIDYKEFKNYYSELYRDFLKKVTRTKKHKWIYEQLKYEVVNQYQRRNEWRCEIFIFYIFLFF